MTTIRFTILAVAATCTAFAAEPKYETVFEDSFAKVLGEGWTWVRENKAEWKIESGALRLHSQPGNIWAGANKPVRNILLRKAPQGAIAVEVTVDFLPEKGAEQAGIFYLDDDNYIKIGREKFQSRDVAMVAERQAKASLIKKATFPEGPVRLRLQNSDGKVSAFFKGPEDKGDWTRLAEIPALEADSFQIGLYSFMGDDAADRWATFRNFLISAPKKD